MLLELLNVSKSYKSRLVLDKLNFFINQGEIYGLLGPNGAGKTTTINILCNLLLPDQGTIKFNNQVIGDKTKSLIGVAPQETILYKNLSASENLFFFGRLYGLSPKLLKYRVRYCLEVVNLGDRANSLVRTLSGGMQRRLHLAIALVNQPKLLILDEPTTGLDIESRYQIWKLIRELRSLGVTILLTTHALDEAEKLCDRIGILKQGKILAQGTLNELKQIIKAQEILIIKSPNEQQITERATQLGFTYRHYGIDLAIWLPRTMELREIIAAFEGIELEGIIRQAINLEHIYLELIQS